jgi:hypothetical protein
MSSNFIRHLDCFIRKVLIKLIIIIGIVFSIVFYSIDNDTLIVFTQYLEKGNGSINTMASIFTGVYFSLFTLMLSLPSFSIVKQLGKKNYHSLLKMLLSGLLWSILYSLWQIVLSFSSNEFLLIVNFLLMLGFISSVLQSALYFSIILYRDLVKAYEAKNEVAQNIQTIKRKLEEIERREKLRDSKK